MHQKLVHKIKSVPSQGERRIRRMEEGGRGERMEKRGRVEEGRGKRE